MRNIDKYRTPITLGKFDITYCRSISTQMIIGIILYYIYYTSILYHVNLYYTFNTVFEFDIDRQYVISKFPNVIGVRYLSILCINSNFIHFLISHFLVYYVTYVYCELRHILSVFMCVYTCEFNCFRKSITINPLNIRRLFLLFKLIIIIVL